MNDIVDFLNKSKSKDENGFPDDGLKELRTAWEKFLIKIVKFLGESPKPKNNQRLEQIENKIQINKNIIKLLDDKYCFLSGTIVHENETSKSDKESKMVTCNNTDFDFLFDEIERSMDYLMDKVMLKI